jgi:hypothetical protein
MLGALSPAQLSAPAALRSSITRGGCHELALQATQDSI